LVITITNMIKRELYRLINPKLSNDKPINDKAIIVLGPRQTGKTTLLNSLSQNTGRLWLNCDDPTVRDMLQNANLALLKTLIGNAKLVVVDEAQRVKNIGLTLKLITDEIKQCQLIVSGSSSLDLANEINEPLTGRKWEYFLYPISWKELTTHFGYLHSIQQLEQRITFGMYPEVVTHPGNEKEILTQLAGSYLYKDLLSFRGIRKPELLDKLLKALAFQIGQEVSYNQLANTLQVDKNTINDYIYLLEQAFIITRLQPLSRNLRNEISTTRKIYFWDTGIRNAVIGNYAPLNSRNDTGALWENFLIVERMKYLHYNSVISNRFFWRTQAQQEIDYVEEQNGVFFAFEFKWKSNPKIRFPKTFIQTYHDAVFKVITPGNFHTFLTEEKVDN
jgi:predicted AAA+ superfamily ATPase